MSAKNASSFAFCTPTRRGSSHEVPPSSARPRLAKISEKRARSLASTRSQASARPSATPTHTPSTLASVGFGIRCSSSTMTPIRRISWTIGCTGPPVRPWPFLFPPRFAPAEKLPPAPVRISARSPGVAATSVKARSRPLHISASIAFFFSGRSSVIVTSPSRRSTRIASIAHLLRVPPLYSSRYLLSSRTRFPLMQMNEMILISVDDHVVEPPDLFEGRVPKKFVGRFPEIVKGAGGEDVWLFEGKPIPNVALNAVAGRRPEEYGFEPTAYSQLRKGCWDADARVDDMNANGVLASLNFPSFVGLAGMRLDKADDKELALAVLQAWNDWHIEDWCGRHPGRFIPLALVPLWDGKLAGEEVRRVAKKGCHAINFVPDPSSAGRPSLHHASGDPLWQACSEEGTTICLHISDASGTVPSLDTPVDAFIANMPVTLYATASDLTYSPILRKFPDIRFALSEGGTGWIPHFLERVDYVYSRHRAWTHQDFGAKRPSQVFLEDRKSTRLNS